VTTLKNILDIYETASGQAINYKKNFFVVFSRNTNSTLRKNIIHLLGVVEIMGHGEYLGLPSMVERDKYQYSLLSNSVSGKISKIEMLDLFHVQVRKCS